MDPTAYRPEENVNRVACLDAFLQRFSGGAGSGSDSSDDFTPLTTGNNASSTPTTPRTSDRNGTPSGVRNDGALAVGEEGSDGGDLRAMTSGIAGGDRGGGGGSGGGGVDSGSASGSCGGVGAAGSTGIARGRDATAVAAAAQAEILKVLDFLFCSDCPLVESTIQVLDKSRVVKVVARNTGRSVWLVQGSRGAPYLCLREYCSCRSFQELVRRGAPHPVLCKHLLAVRLAPALGLSMSEEVDDDKLAMRISSCDYGG
ncbi:conserved unknown protein [Ectocarpus siliculosus]|uniref:SWIM-type domain-containing protein n=1 Tax=Ectocarpus siliculosus TaxID=2880 RepID=D7G7H1_ECTSI|nr:conserved unknown protein [Ectocarpus siliculosus]|eukprot:CBJ27713.1 conserved unknown protein [Ectocarpus siliculosus]